MDKLTSEFYVISPVHAVLYCPKTMKTFWQIVMFCCMIHISRSASVPQWWSVCLTCRCMQVGVPPASAIMRSWYGPCPVPYVLYNKWILKQQKDICLDFEPPWRSSAMMVWNNKGHLWCAVSIINWGLVIFIHAKVISVSAARYQCDMRLAFTDL